MHIVRSLRQSTMHVALWWQIAVSTNSREQHARRVGVASGQYIFAEPLRRYWEGQAAQGQIGMQPQPQPQPQLQPQQDASAAGELECPELLARERRGG